MSRAFVKEGDDADGDELVELQISPHRNLVTEAGQRQIDATVEQLRADLSAARAAEDRAGVKRIQRDLRYWAQRQGSAERVAAVPPVGKVRFGSRVGLECANGARIDYRIVGEDEADPAIGKISYVSPIARLLIGRALGDRVDLPGGGTTIAEIG